MWKTLVALGALLANQAPSELRPRFDLAEPEAKIAVRPNWVSIFPRGSDEDPKSYRFMDGEWTATDEHLSISTAVPLACKGGDHRSRSPGSAIAAAIPKNAELRSLIRWSGGRAIVAYTTPPPAPGRGYGFVELWLATLIPRESGRMERAASVKIADLSDTEEFCSLFRLQGNTVLVVAEIGVASEFYIAAYAFEVTG